MEKEVIVTWELITKKLHNQWQIFIEEQGLVKALAYYIPAQIGPLPVTEKPQPALAVLNAFLADNRKPCLLLSGDSGTGKTFFCQWFIHDLWQQQQAGKTDIIPLFISLPAQKHLDADLLERFLRKQCDLEKAAIRQLKQTAKLLIILDGYDELAEQHKGKNLYHVCALYGWQAKVIITCRSEALVPYSAQQKEAVFQPYHNAEKPLSNTLQEAYIQAFRTEQIEAYVKQHALIQQAHAKEQKEAASTNKLLSATEYLEAINKLPGVKELIQNPFVLQVVLDVLPALRQRYEAKKQLERYYLTRLDIYQVFATQWFERQKQKLLANGRISHTWAIEKDFELYCQQLANLMWQQGLVQITYTPSTAKPKAQTQFFATSQKPTHKQPLMLYGTAFLLRKVISMVIKRNP